MTSSPRHKSTAQSSFSSLQKWRRLHLNPGENRFMIVSATLLTMTTFSMRPVQMSTVSKMLVNVGFLFTRSNQSCVAFVAPQSSTNEPSFKLLSVISLLSADTPNTDSPANVDAAVRGFLPRRFLPCCLVLILLRVQKEVREDIATYRKKVRRLARKSADEAF